MNIDSPVALVRVDQATTDAGDVPRLCKNWLDNEYWQIDSGRFEGHLRKTVIGNTRILEETQNRTVLKRGAISDDRCHFAYARSFTGAGHCDDQILTATSFSFVPSGEFDILIPPSSIVLISLNREEFMTAAAEAGHWIESDNRRPHTWDMPGHHPLASAVEFLLAPERIPASGLPAPEAGYLNAVLFDSILTTLDEPACKESRAPTSRANAYRIVRAACEFIASVGDDPLTVLDLCRVLKVSRRTLQYSFTAIHGIAPLAYLKYVRLNRARRDLIEARNALTSVASVATHWGFWHLGRFSQDYRRLFGELPSETLRRALT